MDIFNKIVLYFFNPQPGREFSYYIIIEIIALILAVAGIYIILRIRQNKQDKSFKKLFQPYPTKLFLMVGLLLAYSAFRYYYVAFFSMRLLLFIILGVSLFIVFNIIKTYLKIYPGDKENRVKRLEMNKWIPKKKKDKKR